MLHFQSYDKRCRLDQKWKAVMVERTFAFCTPKLNLMPLFDQFIGDVCYKRQQYFSYIVAVSFFVEETGVPGGKITEIKKYINEMKETNLW
jgi:hypothetical protein